MAYKFQFLSQGCLESLMLSAAWVFLQRNLRLFIGGLVASYHPALWHTDFSGLCLVADHFVHAKQEIFFRNFYFCN